jgi:hypothetical protein
MNEDWPADLVHDGQTEAFVRITMGTGRKVERWWRQGKQGLVLIEADGTRESLAGKKGLEERIWAFTGLRPVTLDTVTGPEDINFVRVEDELLLLRGRADTTQRRMAGLSGGGELETARNRLLTEKRQLDSDLQKLEPEIQLTKEKVKLLDTDLHLYQELLQNLQALEEEWKKLHDARNDLLETLNSRVHTDSLRAQLKSLQEERDLLRAQHNFLAELQDEYTSLLNEYTSLSSAVQQKTTAETKFSQLAGDLLKARQEQTELQLKVDEMNVCVACGRPL